MKIKTMGTALVVTSELKLEDIKNAEKLNPALLAIKDEEGNETFRIASGNKGSFTAAGIIFNGHNTTGEATMTAEIESANPAEIKKLIATKYAKAIIALSENERIFEEKFEEYTHTIHNIIDSIEIVD